MENGNRKHWSLKVQGPEAGQKNYNPISFENKKLLNYLLQFMNYSLLHSVKQSPYSFKFSPFPVQLLEASDY
ncbi:MAG TPA: hypothetical protein VGZ90_07755 [Puia sp.]|nr:hypothetical protein [Puia sp.]